MKCTLRTASAAPSINTKAPMTESLLSKWGGKRCDGPSLSFTSQQVSRRNHPVTIITYFFSRSRLAKPARTVAARSWGPRRSSSSPSCRAAVASARRVRRTQTRTTTRTSSWWWKKWLHSKRCVRSSLRVVYYHEAGGNFFFIIINLSSGRRIKCIDSNRSGEWVILRYVSCPEISSI